MIGIRKRLNISMVSDGNGRHPPLIRSFDQVLALGYAVHIAHFRVAVQFDSLYLGIILSLLYDCGDLHDSLQRCDRDLLVKRIKNGRSLDLDPASLFQGTQQFINKRCGHKQFAIDRVRKVRQGEFDDRLLISDVSAAV